MKKSWVKKLGWSLLILLALLQLIRPSKNLAKAYGPNDYTSVLNVPQDVRATLERSCFDCHSNFTHHKWYENIQPIGWWIANHIHEGKEELNFSEFSTYSAKRRAHKLEEIAEEVSDGEMPLSSYLWMHHDAKLSEAEKTALVRWVKNMKQKD